MIAEIDIDQVRHDVEKFSSLSEDEKQSYVGRLASQLFMADFDQRLEMGFCIVAGEEGDANLEQATEALLHPRRSHTQASKKHSVHVWPTPLEAWMQSEIVAAGIARVNEYVNCRVLEPEEEQDLRERLAAAALGMTLANFLLLKSE